MVRWVVLVLLLGVMAVSPAQSQSFGPPVAPQQLLVLLDRYGNPRFTLAIYMAQWQSDTLHGLKPGSFLDYARTRVPRLRPKGVSHPLENVDRGVVVSV
jgi:hypothetical protein